MNKHTRNCRVYALLCECLFMHKSWHCSSLNTDCGLNMILRCFRSLFMYIFKRHCRFVHENRCFSWFWGGCIFINCDRYAKTRITLIPGDRYDPGKSVCGSCYRYIFCCRADRRWLFGKKGNVRFTHSYAFSFAWRPADFPQLQLEWKMRQQRAKRVGALKVRYPNELASCGMSHARVPRLQLEWNSPLQPAGRIAAGSPGKKATFAAAAGFRWLRLVARLRLFCFSGCLSPVYRSDVFPVLHAVEADAGDVVICFCPGFFVGVAEGCHAQHSAA